jgi:ubiquinone/menaquinone biosynthesis C-methylase UbiE
MTPGDGTSTDAARSQETERIRRIQDKEAPRYDRQISFFERILFGGGREWVCSRAEGEVLELAAGTARNLPFYPKGIKLTGVELSPEMLAIARERAEELSHDVDLRLGDVQELDFPARASTRWSALSVCAPFPILAAPSPRRAGSCEQAGGCFCSSTSEVHPPR